MNNINNLLDNLVLYLQFIEYIIFKLSVCIHNFNTTEKLE